MSRRDYYEILEVSRTATDQEIKSSYRKLALKFHPDRNPGDKTAEEKFKEAAEAYAILSDGDKRGRYDRFGHAGVGNGAQGFDPSQFSGFEDIFGGLGDIFGFSRRRSRRNAAVARPAPDERERLLREPGFQRRGGVPGAAPQVPDHGSGGF